MSIEKRGKKWRVRYLDGSQHRSRTFLRKADADVFEAEVKLRKNRGEIVSATGGRKTLQEFGVQWFEDVVLPHKAKATGKGYSALWDAHILGELGGYRLNELTPERVQQWITTLSKRTGPSSLRKTVLILQGCMKHAVQMRYVALNPVRAVEKPSTPKRKRLVRPLAPTTVEELRSVLTASAGNLRDATLVSCLAYAGLRPQEALALRWADIKERTLLIEHGVAFGEIKDTKTHVARSVPLLAPLAADLAEWALAQGKPSQTELVFGRNNGTPWTDSIYRNWRSRVHNPAARSVGVLAPRPYDLRHSYSSLRLAEGANPVELAAEMGHSLSTLLATYSHVISEFKGQPPVPAETAIMSARLRRSRTTNPAAVEEAAAKIRHLRAV